MLESLARSSARFLSEASEEEDKDMLIAFEAFGEKVEREIYAIMQKLVGAPLHFGVVKAQTKGGLIVWGLDAPKSHMKQVAFLQKLYSFKDGFFYPGKAPISDFQKALSRLPRMVKDLMAVEESSNLAELSPHMRAAYQQRGGHPRSSYRVWTMKIFGRRIVGFQDPEIYAMSQQDGEVVFTKASSPVEAFWRFATGELKG